MMIIWSSPQSFHGIQFHKLGIGPNRPPMKLTLHHKIIPKESTVIVGVSGGRDSLALMHALLQQRKDLIIIPAHVNYGLRAKADGDQAFTEGMMQRWHLPCKTYKPRKPKPGKDGGMPNTEAWAREKRYEFFEKLRKKHKADFILTAHHRDDDFETFMLHFIRGTRVKGLSGMQLQREHLLRPLLHTSRDDINKYIEEMQIPYVEDESNKDETYARNFLRHKIVPVLNHVYPGLAQRWQGQKEYWLELQEMLEVSAETFLDEFLIDSGSNRGLNREAYKQLPFPIRATVLEIWFRETTGKMIPDSATLARWDKAILTFPSRKKTEWDNGRFLTMTKEQARLGK
jgi:tRNA(Ile)-lysidine synthase